MEPLIGRVSVVGALSDSADVANGDGAESLPFKVEIPLVCAPRLAPVAGSSVSLCCLKAAGDIPGTSDSMRLTGVC